MTIPGQTFTIPENGLGLSVPASTTPLVLGTASAGTLSTLYTITSKNMAVSTFGQGPLPEAVCKVLDDAGGPVLAMRLTGGVAASCGAVTPARVGASTGTVTVGAQVPYDAYEVIIEIVTTGTLGAGEFKYSLDDGRTYSENILIPAGPGTYAIPSTNITATFVPNAGPVFFQDGDTHSFDCVAPYYTTANLSTAQTALNAISATTEWAFVLLTGQPASAADGATMFAAVETHAATMATAKRFVRWIMDAGKGVVADTQTAFAAVSDPRVCVCYGSADMNSGKPIAGWGTPMLPIAYAIAGRAAASLISTDLARVASGALNGIVAISHDEYALQNLDNYRLTTLRTWPGRAGFYVTNCRLKSDAGSDFAYWQHGRVIDTACTTTNGFQALFIGVGVRTNTDGTIDARDKARFETRGTDQLANVLTQPANAEGTRGHCSAFSYIIDDTNDLADTETLISEVSVRPLGYPKFITTTVGFDMQAGVEE